MSYGALADRIGLYQKLLGSDPTCVMVTMTLDSQVGFNQAMARDGYGRALSETGG